MPRYQITAVGVYSYVLVLNPMMGNTENRAQFGPFNSLEELKAFYERDKVEPYQEEGPNTFDGGTKKYWKSFRKGSPLEHMNTLEGSCVGKDIIDWTNVDGFRNHYGHGVHLVLDRCEGINRQFLVSP